MILQQAKAAGILYPRQRAQHHWTSGTGRWETSTSGYIEEIQNMYFTIYSLNRSSGHYDLRPRPHEYVLPQKNDNNFVEWYLFKLSMNTKPPDDRDN